MIPNNLCMAPRIVNSVMPDHADLCRQNKENAQRSIQTGRVGCWALSVGRWAFSLFCGQQGSRLLILHDSPLMKRLVVSSPGNNQAPISSWCFRRHSLRSEYFGNFACLALNLAAERLNIALVLEAAISGSSASDRASWMLGVQRWVPRQRVRGYSPANPPSEATTSFWAEL